MTATTTTTVTLTRQTEIDHARAVDTEVARLWDEYHKVNDQMNKIAKNIENTVAYSKRSYNQQPERQARYQADIVRFEAQLDELRPVRESKRKTAQDYDDANYEGWNRFFLVKHIHRTAHCSSFRDTTRVGWLPNVSGLTEVEAVSEYGETLCTICFPDAPVALTVKAPEPGVCAGSGQFHSTEYLTGRERAYRSAAGYCPVCLRWQGVTSLGKMRKHKADDETRRHALDKG